MVFMSIYSIGLLRSCGELCNSFHPSTFSYVLPLLNLWFCGSFLHLVARYFSFNWKPKVPQCLTIQMCNQRPASALHFWEISWSVFFFTKCSCFCLNATIALIRLMTVNLFGEFLNEEKCHRNITFHLSHHRLLGFFGGEGYWRKDMDYDRWCVIWIGFPLLFDVRPGITTSRLAEIIWQNSGKFPWLEQKSHWRFIELL